MRKQILGFTLPEAVSLAVLPAAALLYGWQFCIFQPRMFRLASALLCAVAMFLLGLFMLRGRRLRKPLCDRRIRLGLFLGFGLLWVALSLNNSSIGEWGVYLEDGVRLPLWGRPRGIRSDEWSVWTADLLAQAKAGWQASNPLIGKGASAAWVSVGGLPAWNWALPFKPLYWGFLLLGAERGFSLMTLLRLTLLAFVSYRCALLYTKNSRPLSVAAACLITLSPLVQWWFSQSICEVLIWPQAMLLLLYAYGGRPARRWGCGLLAAWCLGCFAMIGYPAWLLPVLALTLAFAVLILRRKRETLGRKDWLRLGVPLLLAAGWLLLGVWLERDTLRRIAESAYPGGRLYTGGHETVRLFTGLYSLLFPVRDPVVSNPCAMSNFLTWAPAGLILAVLRWVRERKPDPATLIPMAMEAVFWSFQVLGVPAWLAKATLLSQCTRPEMIISLCDLLLLMRGLALSRERPPKLSLALTLLCAGVSVGFTALFCGPGRKISLALAFMAVFVLWQIFRFRSRRMIAWLLCGLSILGGAFVNPLNQGLATPTLAMLEPLAGDTETLLAVEADWPVTNAPLTMGVHTLNCTQPYAAPDVWRAADPEGRFDGVYNRLCHVSLEISEETAFSIVGMDHIRAELTPADLRALGVTHLLSTREHGELQLAAREKEWLLYRLDGAE